MDSLSMTRDWRRGERGEGEVEDEGAGFMDEAMKEC